MIAATSALNLSTGNPEVKVKVRVMNPETQFETNVKINDDISALRDLCAKHMNMPKCGVILKFGGAKMEDGKSLKNYDVDCTPVTVDMCIRAGLVQVDVRYLISGDVAFMSFDPEEDVSIFRARCKARLPPNHKAFRILYGRIELKDQRKMDDYHISNCDQIDVTETFKGGRLCDLS